MKTSENFWLSEVFRRYENRPVTWNGLSPLLSKYTNRLIHLECKSTDLFLEDWNNPLNGWQYHLLQKQSQWGIPKNFKNKKTKQKKQKSICDGDSFWKYYRSLARFFTIKMILPRWNFKTLLWTVVCIVNDSDGLVYLLSGKC